MNYSNNNFYLWLKLSRRLFLKVLMSLVAAGANFLVMGSAIFADADPEAVIKEAYEVIKGK